MANKPVKIQRVVMVPMVFVLEAQSHSGTRVTQPVNVRAVVETEEGWDVVGGRIVSGDELTIEPVLERDAEKPLDVFLLSPLDKTTEPVAPLTAEDIQEMYTARRNATFPGATEHLLCATEPDPSAETWSELQQEPSAVRIGPLGVVKPAWSNSQLSFTEENLKYLEVGETSLDKFIDRQVRNVCPVDYACLEVLCLCDSDPGVPINEQSR